MAMAGYAMMAVGAIQEASAAKEGGERESAILRYNADVMEAEAKQTRVTAAQASKLKRDEMRRTLASNRASVGASGLQMTGTPAQNQLNVIDNYAYDIAVSEQEGEVKARRFESEADIFRMRARSAQRAGKTGFWSALLGGAGNIGSSYAANA